MGELVETLDRLARRRPRRRRRIPAILFQGSGGDDMVRGYRERLVRDGLDTIPYAFVDGERAEPPLTDTDLLDQVADALRESLEGGIRRMHGILGLRQPRYKTLRHLLDADAHGGSEARRKQQLLDAIYAGRGEPGAPSGWSRDVAGSIEGVQVGPVRFDAVGKWLDAGLKWLLRLRLQWGLRFRWVGKELAGRNFFAAGVHLAERRRADPNDAQVRRLLTLALLRDLNAATRSSLLSPFRRSRVTPFVVHLAHVRDGSPMHRWLTTLAGVETGAVRRHTLMVLASLTSETADDSALRPQGARDVKPAPAAELLARLCGRRPKELPFRVLVVDVPDGPEDNQAQAWLDTNFPVSPPSVFMAWAVPVACYAVVGVGVALWVLGGPGGDDPCGDVDTERGDERVGVVEDVDECAFVNPDDLDGDHPQHPVLMATEAATRDIARENEEIPDDVSYVTVVFFAPLTAPDTPGRLNENALSQLQGMALAQQQANEAATEDPERVFTRVVLANPGDRFAYGEDVARDIVDLADNDETVIGVVGIGQSRGISRRAIDILGQEDLPVVAGPVTGDGMVGSSPHYFQISPRNQRIARMLVELTTREGLEPVDGGAPVVPDAAVLVGDVDDEYSWNLADDIRQSLLDRAESPWQPENVHAVSYSPNDGASSTDESAGQLQPDRQADSQSDVAAYVCEYLDARTVVFYTGRSQQFGAFLRAMDEHEDCPDRYTVVGGSALTKIAEDPAGPLTGHAVSLYYPAFASRYLEHPRDSDASTFVERYDEAYGNNSAPVDVSDAAAAYDAFDAIRRAADQVHSGDLAVTGDLVAQELGNGRIGFDGATGYVRLGGGPLDQSVGGDDPPPVPLDKLVLVLHRHDDGTSEIVLACGRLADDNTNETWGSDDHRCPDVD